MKWHFFAYIGRMKLIKRWGLCRSTIQENDQEHSHMVSVIAHALAVLHNTRYGGNVDVGFVTSLAVFHEAPEVLTGDLVTPIKYFNPEIQRAYKDVERLASERLLGYLPKDLRPSYEKLLLPDETSVEWRLVKAADRISAYIKCVEEEGYGNREFLPAGENIKKSIEEMQLSAANDFMREFVPSFSLALDMLN